MQTPSMWGRKRVFDWWEYFNKCFQKFNFLFKCQIFLGFDANKLQWVLGHYSEYAKVSW